MTKRQKELTKRKTMMIQRKRKRKSSLPPRMLSKLLPKDLERLSLLLRLLLMKDLELMKPSSLSHKNLAKIVTNEGFQRDLPLTLSNILTARFCHLIVLCI